jgi:hypothetical protein
MLHELPDLGCGAPSGQDRRRGLTFDQERTGENGVERVKRVQKFLVRPQPRCSCCGWLRHFTIVRPYASPLLRLPLRPMSGFQAFRTPHLALLSM